MVMLRDLSIYWSMIHILIVFILLFRPRFARKKTVLITGICMGVLMLLNGGLLAVAGFEVLGKVFLITCTVPSLILFYVLSADRNFKFFFE